MTFRIAGRNGKGQIVSMEFVADSEEEARAFAMLEGLEIDAVEVLRVDAHHPTRPAVAPREKVGKKDKERPHARSHFVQPQLTPASPQQQEKPKSRPDYPITITQRARASSYPGAADARTPVWKSITFAVIGALLSLCGPVILLSNQMNTRDGGSMLVGIVVTAFCSPIGLMVCWNAWLGFKGRLDSPQHTSSQSPGIRPWRWFVAGGVFNFVSFSLIITLGVIRVLGHDSHEVLGKVFPALACFAFLCGLIGVFSWIIPVIHLYTAYAVFSFWFTITMAFVVIAALVVGSWADVINFWKAGWIIGVVALKFLSGCYWVAKKYRRPH